MWDSLQKPDKMYNEDEQGDEDENDDKQLLKPEERESLTSSLIDEIHGEGLGGVAANIFKIGLVNNDVKDKVQRLQKQLKLKQIPSSTIPFFREAEPTNKESSKFSPFVKVQRNDQVSNVHWV